MTLPRLKAVAAAYQVTPRRVQQLRKQHGAAAIADPDALFDKLVGAGRGCPLRSRLKDPDTRAAIREEIDLAVIRGNVPDMQAKLQSIQ